MTVQELILELQKHDVTLPVFIGGDNIPILEEVWKIEFNSNYGIIILSEVLTYEDGEIPTVS